MELAKLKKIHKEETFVHCTVCANYRNINSYAHRKSKSHQKMLNMKLSKISFYLKQKLKKPLILHDEQWSGKNAQLYCHFCGCSYDESQKEDEFIVENLGCLYHHASSAHFESVKSFLITNFSTEAPEKYCTPKKGLESFLQKLPEEKRRYLKKMDILNNEFLMQIKVTEEERKKLVETERQALQTTTSCDNELQSSTPSTSMHKEKMKSSSSMALQTTTFCSYELQSSTSCTCMHKGKMKSSSVAEASCSNESQSSTPSTVSKEEEIKTSVMALQTRASCSNELQSSAPCTCMHKEKKKSSMAEASCSKESNSSTPSTGKKKKEIKTSIMDSDPNKIHPWFENDPVLSSAAPVIGPTLDTLVKHVRKQKKKGLSKKCIGANFCHLARHSVKWLPSYQSSWNKNVRKQMRANFNREHKNSNIWK